MVGNFDCHSYEEQQGKKGVVIGYLGLYKLRLKFRDIALDRGASNGQEMERERLCGVSRSCHYGRSKSAQNPA